MNRKRILFFVWGYSLHAVRRMKVFQKDPSFEVAVISRYNYASHGFQCFHLKDYRDDENNISRGKLQRLALSVIQLIKHRFAIKRYIQDYKPDVIFLQTLLYPSYLSLTIRTSIPIVITFWNGDVIWWAKWDWVEKILKYHIVRAGIKKATAITVNSETARAACLKYYPHTEKVALIRYPGVDQSLFRYQSKAESRSRLGICKDYVFLCPRGFANYLHNETIILAANQLKDQISNFTFIFISGNSAPPDVMAFKNRVVALGLTDYINVIDKIPWENMPLWYSAADLVISLSSNDSQPNCMLESMSAGTPVVMGDIPQIREWISHGVTGFLVDNEAPEQLSFILASIIFKKMNLDFVRNNAWALISERADKQLNEKRVKDLINSI